MEMNYKYDVANSFTTQWFFTLVMIPDHLEGLGSH